MSCANYAAAVTAAMSVYTSVYTRRDPATSWRHRRQVRTTIVLAMRFVYAFVVRKIAWQKGRECYL